MDNDFWLTSYTQTLTELGTMHTDFQFTFCKNGKYTDVQFTINNEPHWSNLEEYIERDDDGLIFYLYFHGQELGQW